MLFNNFTETATVVARINPYVAAKGYTVETLATHMRAFAHDLRDDGNFYGSTFGYVLTLFAGQDGEMICVASVAASMVETFLQTMK